jgi:hypothetical protein
MLGLDDDDGGAGLVCKGSSDFVGLELVKSWNKMYLVPFPGKHLAIVLVL